MADWPVQDQSASPWQMVAAGRGDQGLLQASEQEATVHGTTAPPPPALVLPREVTAPMRVSPARPVASPSRCCLPLPSFIFTEAGMGPSYPAHRGDVRGAPAQIVTGWPQP